MTASLNFGMSNSLSGCRRSWLWSKRCRVCAGLSVASVMRALSFQSHSVLYKCHPVALRTPVIWPHQSSSSNNLNSWSGWFRQEFDAVVYFYKRQRAADQGDRNFSVGTGDPLIKPTSTVGPCVMVDLCCILGDEYIIC